MVFFWAAAIALFLVVEAATAALTSIWFAVGSAAALLSAYFNAALWLQIFWFIAVSLLVLWKLRPILQNSSRKQPTNADRLIGMTCIVSERIDNVAGAGSVRVNGRQWMARSEDGSTIEEGATVTALKIEGAKLIVEKVTEEIAAKDGTY